MSRTISRSYTTYDEAAEVVRQLEAAAVPERDISIVANNADNRFANKPGTELKSDAEAEYAGAIGGGIIGGGAGLLAGLGVLAIPGVGPVVAAGWLAATLAGATLGAGIGAASEGIAEMLTEHGVKKEDLHRHVETIRRGGALVAVKVEDSLVPTVETIMGVQPAL